MKDRRSYRSVSESLFTSFWNRFLRSPLSIGRGNSINSRESNYQ